MSWLLVLGTAWTAVAAPLALVIGRVVRCADQAEKRQTQARVPDFIPEHWTAPTTGSR